MFHLSWYEGGVAILEHAGNEVRGATRQSGADRKDRAE